MKEDIFPFMPLSDIVNRYYTNLSCIIEWKKMSKSLFIYFHHKRN